jgi:hypothetical protein
LNPRRKMTDNQAQPREAPAISPEARAFIDRLGQREQFETMIDRARYVVPGLRSIEVVLDEATEEIPAGVALWAHRDDIGPGNDPTSRNWIDG